MFIVPGDVWRLKSPFWHVSCTCTDAIRSLCQALTEAEHVEDSKMRFLIIGRGGRGGEEGEGNAGPTQIANLSSIAIAKEGARP